MDQNHGLIISEFLSTSNMIQMEHIWNRNYIIMELYNFRSFHMNRVSQVDHHFLRSLIKVAITWGTHGYIMLRQSHIFSYIIHPLRPSIFAKRNHFWYFRIHPLRPLIFAKRNHSVCTSERIKSCNDQMIFRSWMDRGQETLDFGALARPQREEKPSGDWTWLWKMACLWMIYLHPAIKIADFP